MKLLLTPSCLEGTVTPPPSKSLLHRELICRCLAGQSTALPPHAAQDVLATQRALLCLTEDGAPVADCGGSGSTLRFLLPVFMAMGRTGASFTGSSRLMQRPVPGELSLRAEGDRLVVTRPLTAGRWELPGGETSQLISGMLLALPLLKDDSDIIITGGSVSRPYLRMTAAVMAHHGVTAVPTAEGYHIPGGQAYHPAPLLEEPDWSATAFWLVLKALAAQRGGGALRVPLPPPPYLQGDAVAEVYLERLPPCVDIADTPDLLMPLALYAAMQPGKTTRFVNGTFLRKKESDRLAAVTATLNALGGQVREEADGLSVVGVTALRGGEVSAWDDHRIAMMAGCAAMTAQGCVTLTGAECVAKSYPAFWRELAALGGKWEVLEP